MLRAGMKVELYTKDNCPRCQTAKQVMASRKVEYTLRHVPKDISRDDFMNKFPKARQMPVFAVDGKYIGGLSEFVLWCAGEK